MVWHETLTPNVQEIGIHELSVLRDRLALLESKNRPIFIHIAGASGAGKTTCGALISSLFDDCQTFEMDRYLKGQTYVDSLEITQNASQAFFGWDDVRVFDLDSIQNDLRVMHEGKQITVPIFNRQKGEPDGTELISPSRYILVEGIHALHPNLASEADIKILVAAPFHDRLMRRMVRNYLGYGLQPVGQILTNYIRRVEPSYLLHHQQYLLATQYYVDNPGNPDTEFVQFLNHREFSYNLDANPTEAYQLAPLDGFGAIREKERLIIFKHNELWQLQYIVGKIEYINTGINAETIETLRTCYSFNKI